MCLINPSTSEFSYDTDGEVEVLTNCAWRFSGGFHASHRHRRLGLVSVLNPRMQGCPFESCPKVARHDTIWRS